MTTESAPGQSDSSAQAPASSADTEQVGTQAAHASEGQQQPAQASSAAPAEKPEPAAWALERIDRLTRELREEQEARSRAVAAYEQKIADLAAGRPALSEQDVERRAMELAHAKTFQDRVRETHNTGKAEYQDFDQAMSGFSRLGGATPQLVQAVLAQGKDAHRVMYELSKDLGTTAEIMNMDPLSMAAAVTRFALTKVKAPEAAPRPSAPAAPPVVGGGTGRASAPPLRVDSPTISMADFVALRKKQKEERRRA